MRTILEVDNLSIAFEGRKVVHGSTFSLQAGALTAIVGESGSGKSLTALSILRLLDNKAQVRGQIRFFGEDKQALSLLEQPEKNMAQIRGKKIAMIFQEPMTSLNPLLKCGQQVQEMLRQHTTLSKAERHIKVIELFTDVELPSPETIYKKYPHELSGGQKQRVMIAMAVSCDPAILIADEPTTALDVKVQKSILLLLKKLQQEKGLSILFISHDLALVQDVADNVIVMREGNIVEQGTAAEVLQNPQTPYTKALIACKPQPAYKGQRLPVISDFLLSPENISPPAHYYKTTEPGDIILRVENLTVSYAVKSGWLSKTKAAYKAVDDVCFEVRKNEIVGLVGESGCGKTTLGRSILNLVPATSGHIYLHGNDLNNLSSKALKIVRKDLQIVFQDPFASLNPRIKIGDAIAEPMALHGVGANKNERRERVAALLESVRLGPDIYNRYPHQFSGGQRQRICIARALALDPSFIIFDESVSALDVSVQAQVLNIISELKEQHNFTSIFISHDLGVIHYISDRIMVMEKGKIVETGAAHDIFFNPKTTYTQSLLEAIPGMKKI